MIQTLNPYNDATNGTTTRAKTTAEIMARYRPIAPKPTTDDQTGGGGGGGGGDGGITSEKIRQSPYLRRVWSHLQARPTRTRKRGRTSTYPLLAPPSSSSATKRDRPAQCFLHGATTDPSTVPHQQFCPIPSFATARAAAALVTLPLLPPPPCTTEDPTSDAKMMIDLNKFSGAGAGEEPITAAGACSNVVISPRPIRLVGSSISIRAIRDEPMQVLVKVADADEVEQELDSEALPAIVSDSKNKVRLVNSAYKEMVGQPLCPWLDTVQSAAACDNRICGEVMLHLFGDEEEADEGLGSGSGSGSARHHPMLSTLGFSCLAKIEWGTNGAVHDVFCQTMRLFCESKDYMFAWRFHTRKTHQVSA